MAILGVLEVEVVKVIEQFLVVQLACLAQHLQDQIDACLLPMQELGEFERCRGTTEAAGEQTLGRLQHTTGDDEGLVVALGLLGLGDDVVHGGIDRMHQPGMKAALRRFIVFHRGNQADRAFLKEIAERDAAFLPGDCRFKDQVEIVFDQPAVGEVALAAVGRQQAALFLTAEARIAGHLRAVIIFLVRGRRRRELMGHDSILRAALPNHGRYHQGVKRAVRLFFAAVSLAALLPVISARAAGSEVLVANLNGAIDPITDNYLVGAINRAVNDGATALVVQMDTPGGLDTSMRDIIKHMIGARVPVVVYVSPSGARAASAGMYITLAADIAAMAPGTNIGSAHPVTIGGSNPAPSATPSASGTSSAPDIEDQKIENDAAAYARALATLHHHNAQWAERAVRQSINATAEEAVAQNVVDLESRDLPTLLNTLDGRQVSKGGQTYTLRTAEAAIVTDNLSGFDQLLQALIDPNVAYLLLLLAIIGIGFWVTHPGLIVPGVIGVVAALFAALSLFDLPVNTAGVILILFAIALFIVDLKAMTHGVLTTGGIIAMTLGGLLLVNTGFLSESVNIPLLLLTVAVIAGIFLFILQKAIAARHQPYAAGEEAMVGRIGSVREPLDPTGMVFVDGALWQATSSKGSVPVGGQVRIIHVDGLHLEVEPLVEQSGAQGPRLVAS